MNFFDTFSQMMVLFFAMLCGYAAHKAGFLNAEGNRQISALTLNLLLPCLILGSVLSGDLPSRGDILSFLGITLLFFATETAFVLTAPRLLPGSSREKGAWRYALFFPNTAYVGYPVILSLYGSAGMFYGVILNIPYNLLCFSLGPLLISGASRFDWRRLRSPGLVVSAAALVIALARIRLPEQVGETLSFVGDVTVPLSLLLLGSLLAELPLNRVFAVPKLWALSAVRLLLMPAALAALLRLWDVPALMAGVAVLEMGMPAAVNGSLMCMEHGGDTDAMSALIFLSTLASMVTIPLVSAALL